MTTRELRLAQGKLFDADHTFATVAAGGVSNILLELTEPVNAAVAVTSNREVEYSIYRDPTVDNNGTEVSVRRMNTQVDGVDDGMTIYSGTTTTDDGTLVGAPTRSGSTNNSAAVAGAPANIDAGDGRILSPGKYLLKAENISGSTGWHQFSGEWYVDPPTR